jgi:hypothetical protein
MVLASCFQVQLDHGFVVGVQPDSPWVIVSGMNPNEDEPERDPSAASSGTGKDFDHTKHEHARLVGTQFLIRSCCGLV